MCTRKTVLLLVGTLIIMLLATHTQYAQPNWSIYLLTNDSPNADLVHVDSQGSIQAFSTRITRSYDPNEITSTGIVTSNAASLFFDKVAISHDGTRLAYCKGIDPTPDNARDGIQKSVVIRDIVSETNLSEFTITTFGGVPGCIVTAFSDDDTQVAVSYIHEFHYLPGTPSPQTAWELALIDVITGNINHLLIPDGSILPEFLRGSAQAPSLMPSVEYFDAQNVGFVLYPSGGGSGVSPQYPAYNWDLDTDLVTEHPYLGYTNADYLSQTGEVAFIANNSAYPAYNYGMRDPVNTVYVASVGGVPQPVYCNTTEYISRAHFVDEGQSLAIYLIEGCA